MKEGKILEEREREREGERDVKARAISIPEGREGEHKGSGRGGRKNNKNSGGSGGNSRNKSASGSGHGAGAGADADAGASKSLYSQYLSLLGQEKEGNGRQVSPSRSRSPSERRQLKGRETGEIIKRRGAGKERRGGNRRQQSKLVEAQRQFFRSCVTQDRLDLALQYVDALDTSSCSPSSAHARGGEGRQGVKGSKSTRKEFQGTKERDQAKLYQSLLSSCVRLNAFQSACDVHKRQKELGLGSNAFAYSMLISLAGKMRSKANLRKKWRNTSKGSLGSPGSSFENRSNSSPEGGSTRYIHTYLRNREDPVDDVDVLLDYITFYFEMSVREECCNVVVCNAALDAYGRNACSSHVFQLHERMRGELGIEENTETFNILMQNASRTGNHSLVFKLREEMKELGVEPSERTFSILLASVGKLHQQQSRSSKKGKSFGAEIKALDTLKGGVTNWAFSILEEMKENEIQVNNHILSALFSACAIEGKGMKRCERLLLEHMEASSTLGGKDGAAASSNMPNVNVWCSFIKLCGACGEVDLAMEVCEKYCERPLSPYVRSALCSAIARAGSRSNEVLDDNVDTFGDPDEGWDANKTTLSYHSRFERYCKKAIKWHNDAHKEYLMQVFMQQEDDSLDDVLRGGSHPSGLDKLDSSVHPRHSDPKKERDETVACNAVIHMCAVCGLVQQAFRAYVDMRRCNLLPDCTTFNSLIWCCSRADQPQRAIKAYEHMQSFGLAPDEVTYGVLMDLYANMREPDQCMKLFIKMKEEDISPNIRHYTSLINAYGKAGTQDSVQKSFLIYKMMKLQGIKPTEVTLSCLIDACRRIYDVDRAFQYFVDVCKEGIVPSDGTYHHFLKICFAHGRVDDALSLILKVVKEDIMVEKKRKETLDALVVAMSKEKLVEKALDLYERVETNHEFGVLSLSSEALVALCISCCQDGFPLEAYTIFNKIKPSLLGEESEEEQCKPSRREMSEVYSHLVQALGNGGQYKDMIEVSKECELEGNQLNIAARVVFITACCNAQLLHQARDSFMSLIEVDNWIEVGTEKERDRVKSMFDTLIVSCCRGNMTEFGLEAFDVWRSVTWEIEKHDSDLGMGLRLSSVTLAFLESCCRKDEALEWRIFDVCAEMRRQQYNKKIVRKELNTKAPKISHHFEEHADYDDDEVIVDDDLYDDEPEADIDLDWQYQDVIKDYE